MPAIGFLGKDGSGYSKHAASPTPLLSPSNMYSGQPLPYAYATHATNTPSQSGYVSPSESRRTLEDEKDKATPRQSLPSIHEALGNDPSLPYPAPTSAPQSQPGHTAPPSHLIGRPGAEGPAGPPNPFSANAPPAASLMREPAYPHQSQLQADASRNSLTSINTQESRNASLNSLSTGKSPTQSAKTGITSVSGSQNSSHYDYSAPPSAGSVASPNGYNHFPPNYNFPPSQPAGPSYPQAPYDSRYMGAPRVDEVKGGFVTRPIPGQPHSDSVKRHLDVYDVETSLNEVWIFSYIFSPVDLVPSQLFGPRNWGSYSNVFSILRTPMNGFVINGWEIAIWRSADHWGAVLAAKLGRKWADIFPHSNRSPR